MAVVGVLATAFVGRLAIADDVESARQHYTQGSKDFDLGLYDKAVQEYMAAYDAKPDPALLYNIAQAHKLAGHPAEAIRFYKTYLSRVPDAPNADEVHVKIEELQKAIEQQKKAQQQPPDQVQPMGSVPSAVGAAAAPINPGTTIAAPARNDRRSRLFLTVGLTVSGIGVAALVTGATLSAVAKQDANQLSALDQSRGIFDPAKDSSGRALGTAGPVLIGVGGALVVVGGVVAVLGWRARGNRTSASLHIDGVTRF